MAESRIFDGSSWITITDEEHRNASDPHTQYHTDARGDARYIRTVNGTGPDGNGNVAVSGGGGGLGPQPISVMLPPIGQYLPLRAIGGHTGTQTISSTMTNSTTSVPLTAIEVVGGCTVDRWGVYLSTPATDAGAVLKAALYRSDLTLVRDLGEVEITGAAGLRECDISQLALTPGVYFIALQVSAQTTSGTNPTFYGTVAGLIESRSILNSNNHFGYVGGSQVAISSWPESLSITSYSSSAAPNMVRVSMRRSS